MLYETKDNLMRWKLFFASEWPKDQLVQLWIDLQPSVNGESVNICLGMYMLRVQADKQKQIVVCVCVCVDTYSGM